MNLGNSFYFLSYFRRTKHCYQKVRFNKCARVASNVEPICTSWWASSDVRGSGAARDNIQEMRVCSLRSSVILDGKFTCSAICGETKCGNAVKKSHIDSWVKWRLTQVVFAHIHFVFCYCCSKACSFLSQKIRVSSGWMLLTFQLASKCPVQGRSFLRLYEHGRRRSSGRTLAFRTNILSPPSGMNNPEDNTRYKCTVAWIRCSTIGSSLRVVFCGIRQASRQGRFPRASDGRREYIGLNNWMGLQTVGVECAPRPTHQHSNYRLVPAAERCCPDPSCQQGGSPWSGQHPPHRRRCSAGFIAAPAVHRLFGLQFI
jgi:hypothetical protein